MSLSNFGLMPKGHKLVKFNTSQIKPLMKLLPKEKREELERSIEVMENSKSEFMIKAKVKDGYVYLAGSVLDKPLAGENAFDEYDLENLAIALYKASKKLGLDINELIRKAEEYVNTESKGVTEDGQG